MAESKTELEKLKEENETLKKKLNPLSETESKRLGELHNLLASLPSSDSSFEKNRKEYLELSSRVSHVSIIRSARVSNSKKIGG
jgi:chromosome segregation ATPase